MIEDIKSAFNTANAALNVRVSYGRGLDPNDWLGQLRAGEYHNILLDLNPRPEGDLSYATRGHIVEGTLMMYSFAKDDKGAVDALQTWWATIASDGGRLLHDISGKVTLGTVEFLRWRAVGGFQGFAEKFGNAWICGQMVDYAAWVP